MNMAFADLLLGGVCLPLFVCVLATRNQFVLPAFLTIILTVSSQASFITTAALISAERFYAIYWPLKHRTLSTRAYRLFIWTAWILAILVSTIYVLPFLSPMGVYSFTCLYGLFLLVTICSQNIGIWRKFQQKIVPCHQNRAMQIQRLTKPLSIVSVVTLSSLRVFAARNISPTFFMILASLIFSSSSFVNPMVYALRIHEFKQALNLLCFRRHGEMVLGRERERVNIAAADLNDLQLTFEQEVLEDTKL